jgi:hypothetical protein
VTLAALNGFAGSRPLAASACRAFAAPGGGLALRGMARWVHRPVQMGILWPGLAPMRSATARRPTVARLGA